MTSFSLTCIETRDIDKAVAAVSSSLRCFPATTLYWLGTESFPLALPGVSIVNIRIEPFTDFREDINHLCLKFLPQLINTDYNLQVQHDGYAVHREAWTDDFLLYDYIGASWPWFWNGGPYWNKPIVGNGGFHYAVGGFTRRWRRLGLSGVRNAGSRTHDGKRRSTPQLALTASSGSRRTFSSACGTGRSWRTTSAYDSRHLNLPIGFQSRRPIPSLNTG